MLITVLWTHHQKHGHDGKRQTHELWTACNKFLFFLQKMLLKKFNQKYRLITTKMTKTAEKYFFFAPKIFFRRFAVRIR